MWDKRKSYMLVFFIILKLCFSQEAKLITNFSYDFSVSPNIGNSDFDDPNRDKLKDGDIKTKVGWMKQSFVEISIDLPSTYFISKVEVSTYRPNTGWFIEKISLFADEGNGFEFIKEVNTGQKWGCPIDINPKIFSFEDINKKVNRLKIKFENQRGYFSITDIKLYGFPSKEEVKEKQSLKKIDENYYKGVSHIKEGVKLLISNFDKDEDEEIFMGNKYFYIIIEPKLGGVISSFKYWRSKEDFTSPKSHEMLDGGIFSDHVTSQSYAGDWYKSPYEYKIIENTNEKIKVKLSCRGKTGALSFITFNKYYTIYSDKSYIEVDYEVENAKESLIPLTYELWFHNFTGTPNWRKDGKVFYYYPTKTGIILKDLSQEGGSDFWFHNPARGWCGFIDNLEKVGLIFSMDYKYLKCFYSWKSSGTIIPTLEWRFNEVEIPDGGSFKTKIYLLPFYNLENISGAKKYIVGDIDFKDNKIKVSIISGEKKKDVLMETMYRILPEEKWISISKDSVSFIPDEIVNKEIPFVIDKEGSYIFRTVVSNKEEGVILDFEKLYINKTPSGLYTLTEEEPQYELLKREINLTYKSEEVETPHIKWAKPYFKGKTKCLILCESFLTRDIIELAQRIDIDIETTYIYPTYLEYGVGDYVGKLRNKDLIDGLKNVLKNYDWDVLVITGAIGRFFDEEDKKNILEKIKNSKGIIIIEPEENIFNLSILPIIKKGPLLKKIKWEKGEEDFITEGIPFEILPPTDIYSYEIKKNVKTLITGKNNPVLVKTNFGNGRVVGFFYRASSFLEKDKPYGLLPLMNDWYYEIVSEYPYYYEYQFSLLGKAILWAANKEPYLKIKEIKFEKDSISISISTEKSEEVIIEGFLRNKYGELNGKIIKNTKVKDGENIINIDYNFSLLNGLNVLDLFVKNKENKILNWYSSSYFNEKSSLKIKTIELDKKYYFPDDTINLKISLEGEIDDKNLLNLEFKDGYGRLIKNLKQNIDDKEKTFAIHFDNLLNSLVELTATIEKDNKTVDISKTYIFFVKFPEKDEPLFPAWSGWVGYNRGINSYLIPFYYEKLKEIGINAEVWRASENIPTVLYSLFKNNFSILWCVGGIGAKPTSKGDPDHPQRTSNIYELMEEAKKEVNNIKDLNFVPLEIFAGDENTFAYPDQEFDFSPLYLQKFKEYLKEKYETVENLNHYWETNYKNWDEVMPLTLKEIKGKGVRNYTSWCDWRRFGDISFARYFNELRKEGEKINPSIKLGISGTPEPNPYNGYDYYLLSKSLTSIQCYYGINELYSFTEKGKFNLRRWLGGHSEADKTVKFSMYDVFFRGGNGINIWTSRLLFKPDGRYSKLGESIKKYYKPIKEGIGKLLITSCLQKDPISIIYSQNSLRISYAEGKFDLWKESKNAALKLIENIKFDPKWISSEQIEMCDFKDTKVLILPYTYSLSEKEIINIKKFVEKGGLLIGQLGIGIFDDYGRVREIGGLDEVFGIEREKDNSIIRKDTIIKNVNPDFQVPEIPVNTYEKGLKPKKGICIGETKDGEKIIFYNKYGKGEAVYIGCDLLPNYNKFNTSRNRINDLYASKIESFFASFLFKKGLKKKIDIIDEEGKPVPFLKTSIFENGDATYYCILSEYDLANTFRKSPVKSKILFEKKGYVYDILEDREYGYTNELSYVLLPDTVKIFAVVPYEVKDIKMIIGKENYQKGENIQYKIKINVSGSKKGPNILRINVYTPDGKISEVYSKNILIEGNEKEGIIPLSLNEKEGLWKIEIKDLISGKKDTIKFYIRL